MIWKNLIPLLIALAIGWLILRYVKPLLRERRHRAWEEAGLMPHQIDPHAPPQSDETVDQPDRRRD